MTLKHTLLGTVSGLLLLVFVFPCEATELIYGIENEIKDYNISRSVDKNAFALSELVTEGLFYQRPDGSLVPDLVKSFKREGKNWFFDIRPSVFSNGKPLRCKDVYANIEEARNSPRPVKSRLREIDSLRCEGERLVIVTKAPYPQLINRMGYIIRVYEAASLPSKNPIGSGPYVIQEKKGKDLILVRNPYSTKKYEYDQIIFRALRDPWLRDLALISGNVDFLMETFSKIRSESLGANKKLQLFRNPSQMLFYIVLKPSKFTLEQRRYFRDVLYKEKVVEGFWASQVEATKKLFRETEIPSFPVSLTKPAPFSVEVSVVADESQIAFLKHIAKKLDKYGIRLKLRPLEFVSYMKRLNDKNFDAYLFYVDTSHGQNLEALLHSRGNRLDVSDSEIDASFATYASSDKSEVLVKTLNTLEKRVAEEALMIPLYRNFKELVISSRLQVSASPDGFWRDLLSSHKYNEKR